MSRIPIAVFAGLFGFLGYCAAVVVLADFVLGLHWAIQALYFIAAGTLWVFPMRWLMFWSVGQR
jgi:hypothetical protein